MPDGRTALDEPGVVESSSVTIEEGEFVADADDNDPATSVAIAPMPARTMTLRICDLKSSARI